MSRDQHFQLNANRTLLYRGTTAILRAVAFLFYRPVATGGENIPQNGPVLIAPTHRSNVDFVFSLFMSDRKIFFMAKDSLFGIPVIGRALLALGAFPVVRGSADREAMRAAESVLGAGHALILFPEGTRKSGPRVEALHDGAMFIAARSGAVVVPVAIGGVENAFRRGNRWPRVRIIVGQAIEPIQLEGRASRSTISAKTMELGQALQEALDRACQP